jgi:folate-dependent tRNA-U54 methylase TrmFO/GidA
MEKSMFIIGAGLAGSEVALQLAHKGYEVTLCEIERSVNDVLKGLF